MLSPLIFKYDGRVLRVKKRKPYQIKYDDDTAYILGKYNPYIYPYRGKITDVHDAVDPGIYIYNKNTYIVRPVTDSEKIMYSIKNIIELTPESIFKDLNRESLINTSDDIYNTSDDELFKPKINENDDIALAGLKFALSKKDILFGSYSSKFQDNATKNNGKRAITHGSSLKMEMLSRFADVFDLNVGLVFADKNGCINPMDKKYSKVYVIYDSDPIDFNDKEIVTISASEIYRKD